jgi:hypothetical protein
VERFTPARIARVDFCPIEGSQKAFVAPSSREPIRSRAKHGRIPMRPPVVNGSAVHIAVRRSRSSRLRGAVAFAAALAAIAPAAHAQTNVSSKSVLAAIEGSGATRGKADAPRLYAASEPRRLRPCCAFGGEMRVELLGVPVPGYRHKPLRGAADIGPHEYDPGLLQILPSTSVPAGEGDLTREHNGIVYTCRAGFLDTAHVRDFADLTWFLAPRVEDRLETGGVIDLEDYGGTRRVSIRPVPREKIRRAGRASLAIAIAGRLAFDLSVWREIATWYGYESVPPWPEKLSSFSPEDLFSNLLGTKLAEGILRSNEIPSRRAWDLAMTEWLWTAMDALGVVPVESARALMNSVDGLWWDSARLIPDWRVTVRRKFDRGPVVTPWIVGLGPASRSRSVSPCRSSDKPVALHVVDRFAGIDIDDVAEIDVVASDRLVRHGLPLPRQGDRHIVEGDYKGLIEQVRRETSLGPSRSASPSSFARRH